MLFVTFTVQLIAWAASLSELLHPLMVVTRAMEPVVNVPLPAEQGPSVHSRVTVEVEYVVVPLIVLTTLPVHLIAVVAPWAAGPWPLHWLTAVVEAWAAAGTASPVTQKVPVSSISAVAMAGQGTSGGADRAQGRVGSHGASLGRGDTKPNGVPGTSGVKGSHGSCCGAQDELTGSRMEEL